jgi:hypothetical protein
MIRIVLVAMLLATMMSRSAWAECAWLLWAERARGAGTIPSASYEVSNAYATREECGVAVRITAESFRKSNPTGKMYQAKSSPYEVYVEYAPGEGIRYFCLPDTVDPRGPKR